MRRGGCIDRKRAGACELDYLEFKAQSDLAIMNGVMQLALREAGYDKAFVE